MGPVYGTGLWVFFLISDGVVLYIFFLFSDGRERERERDRVCWFDLNFLISSGYSSSSIIC